MPPPRGGVQAESVVCGDHPKNQMPRDPNHRLAHGRVRSNQLFRSASSIPARKRPHPRASQLTPAGCRRAAFDRNRSISLHV